MHKKYSQRNLKTFSAKKMQSKQGLISHILHLSPLCKFKRIALFIQITNFEKPLIYTKEKMQF